MDVVNRAWQSVVSSAEWYEAVPILFVLTLLTVLHVAAEKSQISDKRRREAGIAGLAVAVLYLFYRYGHGDFSDLWNTFVAVARGMIAGGFVTNFLLVLVAAKDAANDVSWRHRPLVVRVVGYVWRLLRSLWN